MSYKLTRDKLLEFVVNSKIIDTKYTTYYEGEHACSLTTQIREHNGKLYELKRYSGIYDCQVIGNKTLYAEPMEVEPKIVEVVEYVPVNNRTTL